MTSKGLARWRSNLPADVPGVGGPAHPAGVGGDEFLVFRRARAGLKPAHYGVGGVLRVGGLRVFVVWGSGLGTSWAYRGGRCSDFLGTIRGGDGVAVPGGVKGLAGV